MIRKVSVFVLRERAARQELLVFDHPTAGVQVPAGTVEPDEVVLEAARRELLEESGLDVPTAQLQWLAVTTTGAPAPQSVSVARLDDPIERHFFVVRLEPHAHVKEAWEQAADGHVFRLRWTPLEPPPALHPNQQSWLSLVVQRLSELGSRHGVS